MKRHWPLIVILAVYLALGALFATRIPAWQMPDEPAHYNYIRQFAQRGLVPMIEPSDWPANFQPIGPGQRNVNTDALTYEDHQPPLFYVISAPVFALSGGSLTALRLFSMWLGAFTIVFVYLTVATIFPQHIHIAAFAAAFVALLPQHLFMMSGLNNDSLAEALLALVVWQGVRLIREARPTRTEQIALIVSVGLCLWTKATAYLSVPVAATALLLNGWQARRSPLAVAQQLLVPALVAFVLGAPWWAHNLQTYGGADFLGLQRHNAVVVGQPTTAEWLAQYGFGGLLTRLFQTTFQSFWGQFGWMSVLFDARLYIALLAFTLISAVLFGLWWLHGQSAKRRLAGKHLTRTGASVHSPWLVLTPTQSHQLILLAALALFTLLAFIWYNLQFVQHQGRYLFPALGAIGTACALGWGFVFSRREAVGRWLWLALLMGLAALDVYALLRVILPQMAA